MDEEAVRLCGPPLGDDGLHQRRLSCPSCGLQKRQRQEIPLRIAAAQSRRLGTHCEQEIRSERKKSEQAAARLAKIIAEQEQFLRAREKFVDDYINSSR